jgi:IS30 family transposase
MSKSYPHLDPKERRKISRWREAKVPATETAARLGRPRSPIFRELYRNRYRPT